MKDNRWRNEVILAAHGFIQTAGNQDVLHWHAHADLGMICALKATPSNRKPLDTATGMGWRYADLGTCRCANGPGRNRYGRHTYGIASQTVKIFHPFCCVVPESAYSTAMRLLLDCLNPQLRQSKRRSPPQLPIWDRLGCNSLAEDRSPGVLRSTGIRISRLLICCAAHNAIGLEFTAKLVVLVRPKD